MKLYFVRHGESKANIEDRFSTPEVELSDKGIEDAKRVGKMIAHIKFDKVLTSPYTRAMQTQKHAMEGVEAEVVDLLHECECGSLEGGLYKEWHEKYGADFIYRNEVDDFTAYGGENYEQMRKRARDFMAYLDTLCCETVVAFSHAGFILTFFDEVMKREGKVGRNIHCFNGSVSVFEKKENGEWYVCAFNVTSSLFN